MSDKYKEWAKTKSAGDISPDIDLEVNTKRLLNQSSFDSTHSFINIHFAIYYGA